MDHKPTPDELDRQRRQFDASWRAMTGPARVQIESYMNTWLKDNFPGKATAYRFEVNYDDSAEKERFIQRLQNTKGA
jgi:hypothetical protein